MNPDKVNPNRWVYNETVRWTSTLKKLRAEGRVNEEFEILLGGLTLEELIAVKLEVSSKTLHSPLFGLPIWKHMTDIVKDAVIKFAISTTNTPAECARFLGLSQEKLMLIVKKYHIWNYFDERNLKKLKNSRRIKTEDLTQNV